LLKYGKVFRNVRAPSSKNAVFVNYNVREDIEEEKDLNISSFRAMQEDIARRKRERNIDLILKQIQNAQTPFVVRGDSSARISNDDGSVPHYYNHRDIQAIHSTAKLEIEQHSCKLARRK